MGRGGAGREGAELTGTEGSGAAEGAVTTLVGATGAKSGGIGGGALVGPAEAASKATGEGGLPTERSTTPAVTTPTIVARSAIGIQGGTGRR